MQPVFAPRTTRARVSPRLAAVLALVLIPTAVVLAFTWAPIAVIPLGGGEFQSYYSQKIFYLHVPIALAGYVGFAAGSWNGVLYLLKEREEYDIRSYAGVHSGVVFGTLVLITGSLWAKAAWGQWWSWDDKQLVVFFAMYMFYCAYFVLRFSIDAGRARERACAIFAVLGVALFPLTFLAIRIAEPVLHPVVRERSDLEGQYWAVFGIAAVGFAALAVWMIQLEVAGKLRARRGWSADEEREVAHA